MHLDRSQSGLGVSKRRKSMRGEYGDIGMEAGAGNGNLHIGWKTASIPPMPARRARRLTATGESKPIEEFAIDLLQ